MKAGVRLLVLGGTWFVGRAVAEAAVARGWDVTCFNRGRTGRDVEGVVSVRGDRTVEADLERLAGVGSWDAVVDTGAFEPPDVALTAGWLAGVVERYVVVSTVSAYRFLDTDGHGLVPDGGDWNYRYKSTEPPCPDIDCVRSRQSDWSPGTGGGSEANNPGWDEPAVDDPHINVAGSSYDVFRFWHHAVRDQLALRVGGTPECGVLGGAASGRPDTNGRMDVCIRPGLGAGYVWEVKAFGPTGIEQARVDRDRYIAAARKNGEVYRAGEAVEPSIVQAGNTTLLAFSPEAGLRMYAPVSWIPGLLEDEARAPVIEKALADLRASAPASFRIPGLPEWKPDPVTWTETVVALCLLLCPNPSPVPGPG
jgi:hypothetical protein